MRSRAAVVTAMVIVGLVAVSSSAGAAQRWSYSAWGWTEPAGPSVEFRWGEPLERTRLSDHWFVQDCEGDAPFVCVTSSGRAEGVAELVTFSLRRNAELARDIEQHGRAEALRRHAFRFYRTFEEDRQGCRPGYTFHPHRPKKARVAGRDGIRYGFVVRDRDGAPQERIVSFATVTKTRLAIVGAEGLTSRACLGINGPTFRPAQLKAFEPYLARLAATGKLSRPR